MTDVALPAKTDLWAGVEALLDEIRPSLAMHGGDANLMKIENGVVHLKLHGSCRGCPMSVVTFGMALKDMLIEKFPQDIKEVTWNDGESYDQENSSCCGS